MCIHIGMSQLIYLDSDILTVHKDPGEAVTGRNPAGETVLQEWRRKLEEPALQLIHRIDQPVGGLVLLGRHGDTLAALYESFRNGLVTRSYIAIVTAPPDPQEGVLTDHIETDSRSHTSRIVPEGGKEASLHYRTVGTTTHHTVLEVSLNTGRHHQIRVQLASRGWHILGDTRYGARRPMRDRSIGLFARHLSFPHPRFGITMALTAPVPDSAVWDHVSRII
jgi:23S rRNA pseudouridine1911/1915/1917 synthase